MKALQITTDGKVIELDSTDLATLQKGVGGYVQPVELQGEIVMWLNEEGKIEGLPHNPVAQMLWDATYGMNTDYIQGNAVFTGGADNNGETLPITEKRAEELISVASQYEVFQTFIKA
jgi:hypothetical protein